MDDLSRRTAREVLDDHLGLANDWGGESVEDALAEDLRRNVALPARLERTQLPR